MLRIHSVAIQCCAEVGTIASQVSRKDPALADQMRRAMASVALNISEGCGSQGKNRNARYFNALGSAREIGTALEVAVAFGYVRSVDAALARKLDRIRNDEWAARSIIGVATHPASPSHVESPPASSGRANTTSRIAD